MKSSRSLFCLMFGISLLLNLNFTILRSMRTTLAVVDLGGGAHAIPFFELFGAMPCAFFMTWCLTHLINRFSFEKVFQITIVFFMGFFLCFNFLIYPHLSLLQAWGITGDLVRMMISMLFYSLAELWKPALVIILFWGLLNASTRLQDAKKLYAPLMLSGSLGSILAGQITSFCSSDAAWRFFSLGTERWQYALNSMTLVIVLSGSLAAVLYSRLFRSLCKENENLVYNPSMTGTFSLQEAISFCYNFQPLRLLSWIVIADYIAYSLGEVLFLDILKKKFSDPADYCQYLGNLSLWSGILTFVSSIWIAPLVLNHCQWGTAALVTPICLLVTEGTFFIFLRASPLRDWWGWTESYLIQMAIISGSIQYCLCRAAKYTFLDPSKELAFVLMPESYRIKGKLIADGLCARVGRGGASFLSIVLIQLCGGVVSSALPAGVIAIGVITSWLLSTRKLGKSVELVQT